MKYDYSIIVDEILLWFEKEKRDLPWRRNPLPYYVWISEIMLQQTRVEAVKEYFKRFLAELPTIESLATVEDDKLMKLWEGLGYYNRARNLKKAAVQIMEQYNGELPKDYKELISLPGIGSYTAGAIASQAYGIAEPAVDGNVLRVTKRLAGSYDDITKASVKKELEEELKKIMPQNETGSTYNKAGAFNQALMELGAIVCIPNGKPLCEKCPLQKKCIAYEKNIIMELPVKPSKKARKIEKKTVFVFEWNGRYGIHKRAKKGLLANLWEFPNVEEMYSISKVERFLEKQGILEYEMELLGEAKHIFSHVEWHMLGYKIKIKKIKKEQAIFMEDLVWVTEKELFENYALPTAFGAFKQKI